MVDKLIHNVVLVSDDAARRGYLTINTEGLIDAIGYGDAPHELMAVARHVCDGEGGTLIPGLIDTHVHFREPGLTHKGSIASESLKALHGGVTSFIDMPNCRPATTDIESWEWKMQRASATSHINYAFYLGATADNIDQLAAADYRRVAGVKLFLGSSTGNMLLDDDAKLRRLLTQTPSLIAVHAESEELIAQGRAWAMSRFEGRDVPIPMHSVIRSRRACVEGTRRIVTLARRYGARVHICHVSTAQELEMFTPGDAAGKQITAETSANYLTYTCLDYPRLGSAIKCNPALKLPSDRDALRRAVADGRIDTIGSDHAPHIPADKVGDALTAASGIGSIERELPMLLELVKGGYLTLPQVVRSACHNPATIFRIDRRGFLRPGYHADIVLMAKEQTAPKSVWINGKLTLHDGAEERSTTQPLAFN